MIHIICKCFGEYLPRFWGTSAVALGKIEHKLSSSKTMIIQAGIHKYFKLLKQK